MSVVVRGKTGHVRSDAIHVVRGQETRRRIRDAARRRILESGFEALRLDDLAADAGITKPAVIKAVGGKASILLALGEEDRESRLAVLRGALGLRTGLRRRLRDALRTIYALDRPRINLVCAYIGYLWFWTAADHERAQANIDEALDVITALVQSASPMAAARARTIALRVISGYVIGLRDLYYRRSTVEEAVTLALEHALA